MPALIFLLPASRWYAWRALFILFIGWAAHLTALSSCQAQTLYVSLLYNGTVSSFDAATGAAISNPFISGLHRPTGLAISGNDLFVANSDASSRSVASYDRTTGAAELGLSGFDRPYSLAVADQKLYVSDPGSGVISEYDATTRAPINSSLVSSGAGMVAIAVAGNNLYVLSGTSVALYNATTGSVINSALVTGLSNQPQGLTLAGDFLYVVNYASGTVGKYSLMTGAVVNASFISGLSNPYGVVVSGNNLFVASSGTNAFTGGFIGEYNATSGVAINASFITGLASPTYLAITDPAAVNVPEPGTWLGGVFVLGTAGAALRRHRLSA